MCFIYIVLSSYYSHRNRGKERERDGWREPGYVDWNRCNRWKAVSWSVCKYSCITCANIFSIFFLLFSQRHSTQLVVDIDILKHVIKTHLVELVEPDRSRGKSVVFFLISQTFEIIGFGIARYACNVHLP